MKKQIIYIILMISVLAGCNGNDNTKMSSQTVVEEQDGHEETAELHLSELKFNSLGIKVDTLPTRMLSGVVEANGQLEVPPQHEATITAILGANVTSIKVIEGDKVKKGHVLAYLSHPNLITLQTEYMKAYSELQFLEKEKHRQKKLYDAEVGSGKTYERSQSEYQVMQGQVSGYEAQLRQLGLNTEKLKNGDINQNVPVVSPISGFIEKVEVQIGQYVDPQKEMFVIVNTEHIHADLMVFEKDVHKIKKGQSVTFTVESVPGATLSANIYTVGKKFEQNPKAVHVHAEIDKKEDFLIPGMYINGKIHTDSSAVMALPQEALVEEEGNPYIFVANEHREDGKTEWTFRAVEVRTGVSSDGWVEIKLLDALPPFTRVAMNNAYYLISEMQKSKNTHSH